MLKPGHELATDRELLREQSRALQAAHESAAAAHLVAASHRVGEQALASEVAEAEGRLRTLSPSQGGRQQCPMAATDAAEMVAETIRTLLGENR